MSASDRHARVLADLTWTGSHFEAGVVVNIDASGTIAAIDDTTEQVTHRLDRRALIPGFVNAHSHAFQRGLRGQGETFEEGSGSFWSWRKAMYTLVDRLDPDLVYALAVQAYSEMLACGISLVGEFHYVHHDATGRGYAMDDAIIHAAHDTGIRLTLLQAFYKTGGIGSPLEGGQRRFATPTVSEYWNQLDRLGGRLHGSTQQLGVVAHSIRAVPLEDLRELHAESQRRGLVFHMHVEEQPREIEQCRAAYGKTPMALLNDELDIDNKFTAVHCTHTVTADMTRFAAAGGHVCLCPLTEANLGDGIADAPAMLRANASLCLGTDSNARISMLEEMRWLEYGQRLATESRGIVLNDRGQLAPRLLDAATRDGSIALGWKTGVIEPGYGADLVSIALDHPALMMPPDADLGIAMILGASDDIVDDVCVNGEWIGSTS